MALNTTEVIEARAILNDTNKTEQQRARDYYSYLESKNEDYGRLGKGVSDNDTWQGEIANGFAEIPA